MEQDRFDIVQKILDSEKAAVRKLENIALIFVRPFRLQKEQFGVYMDTPHVTTCIQFLEEMFLIRQSLVERLSELMSEWRSSLNGKSSYPVSVSGSLSSFCTLFQCLVHVSGSHRGFIRAMSHSQSDSFQTFINEVDKHPKFVQEHITVQRIFPCLFSHTNRFKELVSELFEATPEGHPDEHGLEALVFNLQVVFNSRISELSRRARINKLIDLEQKFKGDAALIAPGRELLHHGWMFKVCRNQNKKYMFHLFNDLLLYSSQSSETTQLVVHRKIDLRTCLVEDIQDSWSRKNCFQVISNQKSFFVIVDSKNEKDVWLEKASQAIQNIRHNNFGRSETTSTSTPKNNGLAPVWIPDNDISACSLCKSLFTISKRKHHCRSCGNIICNGCSHHKRVLVHLHPSRLHRVCDSCVDKERLGNIRSVETETDSNSRNIHHTHGNNYDSNSRQHIIFDWISFLDIHLRDIVVLNNVFALPLLEAAFLMEDYNLPTVFIETSHTEFREKGKLKVSNLVSDPRVVGFFSRIRSLCSLNTNLLRDMKLASESETNDIGSSILRFLPLMRMYGSFARGLTHIMDLFQTTEFSLIIAELEKDCECSGQSFTDLIVSLTYTITKHHEYLKGLLKTSSKKDYDYFSLRDADSVFTALFQHWDEEMRQEVNSRVISDVESSFVTSVKLRNSDREWIYSGALTMTDWDFKSHAFIVHLFSDCIILSTQSGSKMKLVQQIPLTDLLLSDQKNCLLFQIQSPNCSFVVHCRNFAEKNIWVEHMYSAIKTAVIDNNCIGPIGSEFPWSQSWFDDFSNLVASLSEPSVEC